jgi:hypothetical protein
MLDKLYCILCLVEDHILLVNLPVEINTCIFYLTLTFLETRSRIKKPLNFQYKQLTMAGKTKHLDYVRPKL